MNHVHDLCNRFLDREVFLCKTQLYAHCNHPFDLLNIFRTYIIYVQYEMLFRASHLGDCSIDHVVCKNDYTYALRIVKF